METSRIYKNTETNDYWEVLEICKPYNVGQNTGMTVRVQLICTSDFKNPLDTMSSEDYEEKGFESFNAFVYSEGIDEAAKANDYEAIGDTDSSLIPDEVRLARIELFKQYYGF